MNNNKNELKNKRKVIGLLLVLLLIGIGYAALGANIQINGVTQIYNASWNVRFKTGSINVTEGSVLVDTSNNEQAATIDNDTEISYAVKLALPGDFYEFTVVAENVGSIDAMIDSVVSKLGNTIITNDTLPSYLKYSVTYSDGIAIASNHLLSAGTEETLKVRLEYDKEVEADELPDENLTLNLNFQVNYVQADDTAVKVIPDPVSFATDSWYTIIKAVRDGNTNVYEVGDTKEIDMGTFGTHTLRISNMSTPSECSSDDFSQTACGFVLEFVDVITIHRMNPWASNVSYTSSDVGFGNIGGWEYSEMRTYLNNTIYNALPERVRTGIASIVVVSGYGWYDSENFTTIDKLYILSTHEVWEDVDTNHYISTRDTAYNNTRQLDYYANLGVTTSNYAGAIKQNNGTNSYWWFRSAISNDTYSFWSAYNTGKNCMGLWATFDYGVSPAFRLG